MASQSSRRRQCIRESPERELDQGKDELPAKRQRKSHRADKPIVDYCQRLSQSIEELLMTCTNETFRENCLNILGVENSSEAGRKTRALAMKLKGKREENKTKKKKTSQQE